MKHALTLGLLVIAATSGCDDKGFHSNQSNDIFLTPDSILFPRVVPPRTEAAIIQIRQGGESDLKIKKIYIEGFPECDRLDLGYSEADILPDDVKAMCPLMVEQRPELPFTLGGDEFRDVNIRFQPSEATVPPATRLVVESNALDKEVQYIPIEFQAATPEIASDRVVSFPSGIGETKFLLIRNIGSGPLRVSQRTLVPLSTSPIDPVSGDPVQEFIVTEDQPLPWVIEKNGSRTVTVEYRPFDQSRDSANLVFQSNDPETPNFTVQLTSAPVYGVLNVTPNPVVYAEPPAGQARVKTISFVNSGLSHVDVSNISIEQPGADYLFQNGQQNSFRLAGGESRNLDLTYQPLSADGSSATLVVNFEDNNPATENTFNIPLAVEGQALPAILNIAPVGLDLSDVAFGETREETLVLTNDGGAALEITRIALSGDDDAPFVVTDPEITVVSGGEGLTLAPGATHDVVVSFVRAVGDTNVHIGALLIESNSATSPDAVYISTNPPQE